MFHHNFMWRSVVVLILLPVFLSACIILRKKSMKKNQKLILKGIAEDSGQSFIKEVRSLDEIKKSGSYVVVGHKVSAQNGFPEIKGKSTDCFCCEAYLTVTCCYTDDEAQSNTAYGQSLLVCDRETGTTNTYSRTISPKRNNGKWSVWQMVATGTPEEVSKVKGSYTGEYLNKVNTLY